MIMIIKGETQPRAAEIETKEIAHWSRQDNNRG